MKLMLFSMLLILSIGFLMGGRLGGLSEIRLRWTPLAVAGLALQFVTGPGSTFPLVCLYVSFVLLTIFAFKNIRVAGFPLIVLGVAMNFLVIGANQGMPVSRQALEGSGQGEFLGDLINNPYPKHHLATDGDVVVFLGDVIAVPKPIAQAISIGDIFTYAGVGVVVVSGMRTQAARREETAGEVEDGSLPAGG
jgi:hypothetical protein